MHHSISPLHEHVPALADGFNPLDPIVVIVLCTTSALAVSDVAPSTR
jgi:hypothetical protein